MAIINTMNSYKKYLNILLCSIIPIIIFLLPLEYIPIQNITLTQKYILAIFALAAIFWVMEPVPNFTTSILVIFLELVLISDHGLQIVISQEEIGTLLSYKSIFSSFSAPIIILFMGGFTLAAVAKKYEVDYILASILLKPFGNNPKMILLGLMAITAIFSMFMSNTATTAMMISILLPVLQSLPDHDKMKISFAIGIPFAANIGGIGTPIGTPPNAIALRSLPAEYSFTFSEWMLFAIPYVVVLIGITWLLLIVAHKSSTSHISLKFEKNITLNKKQIIIVAIFLCTIVLWMTDFIHGLDSYIVAMFPIMIFFISGLLSRKDLQGFNWEILWLVAGGIAIGYGINNTGLAENLVATFNFSQFGIITTLISAVCITYFLSNFMSHTAASSLLFPILVVVATSNTAIVQGGYVQMIILLAVFASSLSMILPISTPPNALGYATGLVNIKEMIFLGTILGIGGIILAYVYFNILLQWGIILH